MSNLTDHAERELKLAGLHMKTADYGGALYDSVMELVRVFSSQDHSGYSAHMTLALFNRVAQFRNIEPVGVTEDEWVDVSEIFKKPTWQNKRDSELFSEDNGEAWYNVNKPSKIFTKSK